MLSVPDQSLREALEKLAKLGRRRNAPEKAFSQKQDSPQKKSIEEEGV